MAFKRNFQFLPQKPRGGLPYRTNPKISVFDCLGFVRKCGNYEKN
jgi:hypothetical protein